MKKASASPSFSSLHSRRRRRRRPPIYRFLFILLSQISTHPPFSWEQLSSVFFLVTFLVLFWDVLLLLLCVLFRHSFLLPSDNPFLYTDSAPDP